MSDALQRAVMKMRSSTKCLNEITDKISHIVKQVEEFLNVTCSAGVYASVNVTTTTLPEEGPEEYQDLVYCRVGSHFRIAVADWWEVEPENRSIKAWAECSRDVKLETAKKLPDLILEIAKQIDGRIEEAQHTSAMVSRIMSALCTSTTTSELDKLLGGE